MELSPQEHYDNYTLCDLETLTQNFSEVNFIGNIQSGKVYRGRTKEGKEVTVKTMTGEVGGCCFNYKDMVNVLQRELIFLEQEKLMGNPDLAKPIGFCNDGEHLALVYDFKAVDTLQNMLNNDAFNWRERVNVAIKFAAFLGALHSRHTSQKYIVRNIHPAHIMIDEDQNPIVLDFSALEGGVFGFGNHCSHCIGSLSCYERRPGVYADRTDVFAFGLLLISLISKRILDNYRDKGRELPDFLLKCIERKSKSARFLVDDSFKEDPYFNDRVGRKLAKIALRCIKVPDFKKRPTMSGVSCLLLSWRATESPAVEQSLTKIGSTAKCENKKRVWEVVKCGNINKKRPFEMKPFEIK